MTNLREKVDRLTLDQCSKYLLNCCQLSRTKNNSERLHSETDLFAINIQIILKHLLLTIQ